MAKEEKQEKGNDGLPVEIEREVIMPDEKRHKEEDDYRRFFFVFMTKFDENGLDASHKAMMIRAYNVLNRQEKKHDT